MGLTPPLPTSFDCRDLEATGFVGWRRWDELRGGGLREVPSAPAVYVVFRPAVGAPTFLDTNPGGRFKEKDLTVPIGVLSANWVPSSQVVYIGKANVADRRLIQFARFGAGEKVGHWGGRYIWQLLDGLRWAHELGQEIAWAVEDCRHVSQRFERALVSAGERVLRVAPKLMGASRGGEREAGKSDQIDARAIARAVLREGVDRFPAAFLDEQAVEIRLLGATRPTPPSPRWQPPAQPSAAHHRDHPRPNRPDHARLPRAQGSRRQEPHRGDALPQASPRTQVTIDCSANGRDQGGPAAPAVATGWAYGEDIPHTP